MKTTHRLRIFASLLGMGAMAACKSMTADEPATVARVEQKVAPSTTLPTPAELPVSLETQQQAELSAPAENLPPALMENVPPVVVQTKRFPTAYASMMQRAWDFGKKNGGILTLLGTGQSVMAIAVNGATYRGSLSSGETIEYGNVAALNFARLNREGALASRYIRATDSIYKDAISTYPTGAAPLAPVSLQPLAPSRQAN